MLRETLSLLLLSCMIGVSVGRCADAQETLPRFVREILPSALAEDGQTVQIRAFNIAPDGSSIAVLYGTWGSAPRLTGAELWVAVWGISSNKLVWKQKIGTDTSSGAARIYDVEDLIFTADQSHLLALAVKRVWCIDAKNGGTPALIAAPDNVSGAPVQIWPLRGVTAAVTYSQSEDDRFFTELVDVSSGKKTGGWTMHAIPQSFSADGKLAITVAPGHGSVDVQVVDTSSGATLRTVPVSLSFEKRHSRNSVSAVARLLDNTQVVLVPNQVIDHHGKPAAYGIEVIDVSDGRFVRDISPEYFRPTGEIVVSSDRSRFAVESIYARERDMLLDSPHPKNLRVNLFVFSKGSTAPEAAIPNVYAGLPGGKGEPLRLSADGSVLAVAQPSSGSIKVFQLKSP